MGAPAGNKNRSTAASRTWHGYAQEQGFSSEAEMWETIAPSIYPSAIGALLGFSGEQVRRRMVACGIKMRPRGGKNHKPGTGWSKKRWGL